MVLIHKLIFQTHSILLLKGSLLALTDPTVYPICRIKTFPISSYEACVIAFWYFDYWNL